MEVEMLTEVLIVLFVYLLAKAFGDTARDEKSLSWLSWFFDLVGAEEWFLGGDNVRWNPSLFWTADFWHLMEHVKAWCLVYLAVVFLPVFWLFKVVLAVVLLWLIGQLFELLYGYVLPFEKKGTLIQWAKRAILFWKREVP
jgi:hypothetical protein